MFKDDLKLQNSEVQSLMQIIAIPWSFKLIYGFITDNVTIRNSRRKSHIIINTVSCIICLSTIIVFGTHLGEYLLTTFILIS